MQWVTHIITVNENTNSYSIKTIEEYIAECDRQDVGGQLETPFQWAYSSGGSGKRIQLKGKLL